MSKPNQKGFAAVESLLIIIIVLLVGFIGYYVWHSQHQANKTLSQADKSTQSSKSAQTQNSKASKQAPLTGLEATASVQKTYDTYFGAFGTVPGQNVHETGFAVVKTDLSTVLYNKIAADKNDGDEIGCAKQYAPDGYRAALISVNSDKTASVGVDILANGGSNGQIKVVIDLVSGKITQITCPS